MLAIFDNLKILAFTITRYWYISDFTFKRKEVNLFNFENFAEAFRNKLANNSPFICYARNTSAIILSSLESNFNR